MPPKQRSLAEAMLYDSPPSYANLPGLLEAVLAAGAKRISVQFVVSEAPLTKSLRETQGERLRLAARSNGDTSLTAKVVARFGGKRGTVSGKLAAVRHPNFPLVWLVLTHESSEFVVGPLDELLAWARPRALYPILSTASIESLLGSVEKLPSVSNLRVNQVGSRTLLHSKGAERSVEAERRWTDLSLREAFNQIRAEDQWATDVTVAYVSERMFEASLKISRHARLTLRNSLGPAASWLLDRTASLVTENFNFLQGRDRQRSPQNLPKPFRIEFRSPVLESPDQLAALRGVLHEIPKVSCTVLHGNPYFHAAMVDYVDGSSYELIALGATYLTVVPQRRSTVLALQRLCERVFSGFHEGEIVEQPGG